MLFDSHCHLDVAEFAPDRDSVLARARSAGVIGQLLPAVDRAHWPGLRALCETNSDLHPAFGIHPLFLDDSSEADLDTLPDWIAAGACAAIGECGLDYFVDGLDHDRQMRVFRRHLAIAREHDLPLVIHARRAVDAVIGEIRRVGRLRGVIHSFGGSEEQARQLFALDFQLGIGGPVTYERARRLRRLVTTMPLDFLLLETDAPDQPDADWRGQRNEPARLPLIAACIAGLRGMPATQLGTATTANARRLLRLPG